MTKHHAGTSIIIYIIYVYINYVFTIFC